MSLPLSQPILTEIRRYDEDFISTHHPKDSSWPGSGSSTQRMEPYASAFQYLNALSLMTTKFFFNYNIIFEFPVERKEFAYDCLTVGTYAPSAETESFQRMRKESVFPFRQPQARLARL
jgi:hypothetical protein